MNDLKELSMDYRRMEILRSVLPYIPVSMQKFLNIYLGLEELFNAIQTIRNTAFYSVSQIDGGKNISDLLPVLRKLCTPKENEMIDTFFQMSRMMDLYGQYKDILPSSSENETASLFQMFDQIRDAGKNSSEIDDLFKDFENEKKGDSHELK